MRSRDGWPGRAALAVAALYGLLLSTFLGAMAPVGPPLPGLLCAREGGVPATPATPAHAGDCCTLGCGASPAGPPPARTAGPDAAAPSQAIVHETGRAWASPRSRPRQARLPRGPPAV
jgi:hypothetical protein